MRTAKLYTPDLFNLDTWATPSLFDVSPVSRFDYSKMVNPNHTAAQFEGTEYGVPVAPAGDLFQGAWYGYEPITEFHGWEWSCTFNRWRGLVTFADGWHGFTSPKLW
jgi:hypothetical protein